MFFGARLMLLAFTCTFILFPCLGLPTSSHLKTTPSGHNESSAMLCADGKGPLLEGQDNLLLCMDECPEGFDCELFSGGAQTGICCPDLTKLFRLYNTELNGDSLPEVLEAGGFTMELRDTAVEAVHTQQQQLHPDRPVLSLIQPSRRTDIRQHQPIGQPTSLKQTAESFTCRRQPLQLYCEDGRRQTQFVLRWYHKNGNCFSYPWGYCPGQPVANDVTLKTKEECELLCLLLPNQVPHQLKGQQTKEYKGVSLSSREFDSVERQTGLDPDSTTLLSNKQTGREVKQIKEGQPPQTTTVGPWYSDGSLSSNEEPIPSQVEQPAQRPLALLSNTTVEENEFQNTRGEEKFSEEELEEGNRQTGFVHEGEEEKPQPSKRCDRISPYRSMCKEDGMPSQFTLRWHSKAGSCFAYPYGYCHEELVYEEEPLKTEQECIEVCVEKHN